jgi:glutamyl-tRNA synthetase
VAVRRAERTDRVPRRDVTSASASQVRKRSDGPDRFFGFEPTHKQLTLEEVRKLGGGKLAPERKTVKLRFAPSPTGQLHIGGARTALMNYLAAKKLGGQFVLRIEDTDLLRSKPEYTQGILESLSWLGIRWDGDVIHQSQRAALYRTKVEHLLKNERAYRDPSGSVFFRMPAGGILTMNDRVKGTIVVKASSEGATKDYVIQRADGTTTFLLANVVDDGEEGITHVIRGDDHVSNAIRQIPLYRALGYQVPEFYHVPLIHGDDGAKLSKRRGAQALMDFKKAGYDPLVVANHLARLGMNVGADDTIPLHELAQRTTLQFSSAPAKIGLDKLARRSVRHLNDAPFADVEREIRARAPALAKQIGPRGVEALVEGSRGRVENYEKVVKLGRLLIAAPVYGKSDAARYANPGTRQLLEQLKATLARVSAANWRVGEVRAALEAFNKSAGLSFSKYNQPLRWALTGLFEGVPLDATLVILGREESLRRLSRWTTQRGRASP